MKPDNQRQAARKFKEFWLLAKDSEAGGYSKFWLSLLSDVLGANDVFSRIDFQSPVPMRGTTKYLDAWIPETKVLIEHKSRGIKLDAPQSGHDGKTPYEQALEYNQARGYSEKARWIVTCNFDEIWVYDMDKPLADPQKIRLGDLPKEVSRLEFLVDSSVKSIREKEKEISIQAGRIVGELYRELLKRYADPCSSETLKSLNRLCVRLVFLFYAEDAELFPKDAFWNFLKETPAKFLRGQLMKLFRVLDTPGGKRDPYLEPELCAFPYTNGGLFKGAEESDIPPLDDEIKELLIRSANFDWREISPTIFGALFESTLNPVTRRAGGMVYTSVENIHKVIDPLFLNDLTRRVNEVLGMRTEDGRQKTEDLGQRTVGQSSVVSPLSSVLRKKLLALQDEMAALTFLDPACGSGNFLTETYICLRRLENRIIAALQQGQGELDLGIAVKVSLAQFHGIEINDFAVAVAKTALWIAEAQMLQETAEILHREPDYLPLKDYDNIVEGNALRMDWSRIGLPTSDIAIISIPGHVPFRDAKAHLTELKNAKKEVVNAAGERFRFTKQIFKALSDKARDQSVGREVHWAAVAAVERLCEASVFLWDEKPRNGSVDISRYAKHGVCFSAGGMPYIAKITSKVYPGDIANVTYSVEAVSIERNDARGITDSIAKGQGLDPSAMNRILHFSEAVKRATAKKHFSYIIGNPPFSGARWMGKEQKADVLDIFGKDWQGVGDLDYVCCWYKKAMDCVTAGTGYSPYQADGGRAVAPRPPQTKVAFVSTNSICQGGAVANLWKPLFAQGLEIDFAHRTFRWDNEAFDKAHVHCVIVGFHVSGNGGRGATALPGDGRAGRGLPAAKTIFDGGRAIPATHINGYLMDAPDAWIESRTKPLCDVPQIGMGNQPIDGGNYLFTAKEKAEFIKKEEPSAKYFHPWYGAEELINGKWRYCLWLGDCTPTELFKMPECLKRVDEVRAFRLLSKRASTRKLADKPTRFQTENFPKSHYIVIPEVSSENRRYIPMGYLSPEVLCSNKLRIMPDATPFHFGVLMSSVHNAWVRAVCGRLKSDYDYSIKIVYNNFPWPECLAAKNAESAKDDESLRTLRSLRQKIEQTAQSILDARAKYPDATLAQMYGDKMYLFPELVAAHEANDRAVLAAYGLAPDTPEPEIVAHLFGLYAEMTKKGFHNG